MEVYQIEQSEVLVEEDRRRVVTEASTVGLTLWPRVVWYLRENGRAVEFFRHHEVTESGDLAAMVYVGPNGWELHIIND